MGGKRVGVDTSFQPKNKCAKTSFVGDNDDDDDRISRFPDEILVHVLSFLSINEAARTSILSSRWINLWKHTPSLNFYADSALDKIIEQDEIQHELLKSERHKYVEWVNSVIQSHESLSLKEFRIRFHLDKSSRKAITRWLEFAFSRQVQRLELDLKHHFSQSGYYCFPEDFLTLSSCGDPKLQSPSDRFKSLKQLSFRGVNLNDGVIEFLMRNCHLLKQLAVHETNKISNIEVCGPSLRLKQLDIVNCIGLKSLKVSSPNLTSLWVTMNEGLLLLENVPKLVEVSVSCGGNGIYVKRLNSALSCCLPQLEILWLMLRSLKETDELCNFGKMPKLKKLVIKYFAVNGELNPVKLTHLIRASPCLEEFELQCEQFGVTRKDREVKDAIIRFPHHHLKVFKFSGYYGHTTDAELLDYVLENCVVLEKIIIDPNDMYDPDGLNLEQTARKNAKEQLEPRVPHHVELVIL